MQSAEYVEPSIPEDSRFVTILSPTVFINEKYESRCYLKSTF